MQQVDWWIPLVTAAIGAFFGALGPVLVVLVQLRHQRRTERRNAVMQLAISDHKTLVEVAKGAGRPVQLAPLTAFLSFYLGLLDLMDNKEDFTPDNLRKLKEKQIEIERVIESMSRNV